MILCDTNILSSFARVGALDLLFKLFPQHQFALPQAVHQEVAEAVRLNFSFLEPVLALTVSGQILIIIPTPEEEQELMNLPSSFGPGESEAVAMLAARTVAKQGCLAAKGAKDRERHGTTRGDRFQEQGAHFQKVTHAKSDFRKKVF